MRIKNAPNTTKPSEMPMPACIKNRKSHRRAKSVLIQCMSFRICRNGGVGRVYALLQPHIILHHANLLRYLC